MKQFQGPRLSGWVVLCGFALVALFATAASADNGNNPCDVDGEFPDVIVGSLHQEQRYGTVGGITAFSIGTNSCNPGTCWLDWFAGGSNLHPVIGQNMFRLKDGRFERLDKSKSRMRNFRDPETGFSGHMEVELCDLSGRSMQAEGFAVSHMCEHGAGSNASMRWEYEGMIGWGEDQDGWRLDHFIKMRNALRAHR